jgi:hypothetical protein
MSVQTTANYALNVALGTGEFVVEKAKGFAGSVRNLEPRAFWNGYGKQMAKTYDQLAGRGAKLRKTISNSGPAKRAAAQTKVARRQVKAAATSVRKAFGDSAEAAKTAAKKVVG